MMKSDTSSSESFDRHFSYGKSGVNSSYSKHNWALEDLADTLGKPASKSGKSNAEQAEFKILKGSTNNDEVVYSGIYPINNLKEARTLMGKGLRACADDNDISVSDFLGDKKDKSDSKYRLPDLDNDKTGAGFCNIVTCVNRAGDSWDYDHVTFGIAAYDFDVAPISADKLKYIEAAQGLTIEEAAKKGMPGVYFDDGGSTSTRSYLKNSSSVENTVTTSLENNESG